MHYTTGDIPAEPLEVDASAADPSHLYTDVSAELVDPSGVRVRDMGSHVLDGDGVATIPWGTVSPFVGPGIYTVRATLTAGTGSEALPPIPIVVEAVDGWHTLDSIRETETWPGLDDTQLFTILQSAKDQCLAFAPVSSILDTVPARFRQAQALQARALWNSGHVGQNDQFGDSGLTVTVFPMDWTVKNLLRPKRPVGGMF